jgi:hypothetical protein
MKRWHWIALGLLTAASAVAEFMGEPKHGPWGNIPAFWAIFGFAGCVVIIIASKAIGKRLLQRREDYYDGL